MRATAIVEFPLEARCAAAPAPSEPAGDLPEAGREALAGSEQDAAGDSRSAPAAPR